MKIRDFAVEQWMNEYETTARYNIAETCVDSVSADELFALIGEDGAAFWRDFAARRLTYGDIEGAPAFREGISRLYRTVKPEEIVTTHGAAGANHHVFYSLVEPGDRVVSISPSYQQLTSIPESFGADVRVLPLRPENGWLPGKFHEWVQMGHRAAALLLFAWIIAAAVHAARQYKNQKRIYWGWMISLILIILQAASGIAVVYSRLDLGFALAHAFFISCLFGILCYFLLLVARYRRQVQK